MRKENPKIIKLLILINIGFAISSVGFLLISIQNNYYWRADFTAFYTGGAIIRDTIGSELYNIDLQTTYQQALISDGSFLDGVLPFNYPPYVAVLFLPLSYLPHKFAFYVWLVIQLFLLLFLIRLIRHISREWNDKDRFYILITLLSFPYLLITLLLGSFSLLMLIGVLELYQSLKSNQDFKAGIWLCLFAVKPQLLAVPLVIVLAEKRWKTLSVAVFLGILTFVTTGLLLGWHIWFDFLNRLILSSTYFDSFGIYPSVMHNLKGALTSVLGANQASTINLISILAFISMLLGVFVIWRKSSVSYFLEYDIKFSLAFICGILFSPHVNPQDSLLLIAPIVIFFNYQIKHIHEYKYFTIFILSLPMIFWISEFWLRGKLLIRLPILIMVTLIIWIILVFIKGQKINNKRVDSLNINIS